MNLAVGDLVVYGNHGVGRVAARRRQDVLGESQDVVVLELDDLTVVLPLDLAKAQLRPPADEADLRRVVKALRGDSPLRSGPWLSRRKETLEKLAEGTPVALAEIVSEGAQRDRLRVAKGQKGQLSLSERRVFSEARELLTQEIALALEIEPAAAENWIDQHLARPS